MYTEVAWGDYLPLGRGVFDEIVLPCPVRQPIVGKLILVCGGEGVCLVFTDKLHLFTLREALKPIVCREE